MSARIVAIIPARGGSKGIPRKNLAELGGKPMLAWSVAAALDSGVVDRVIVSTDDVEIAQAARAAGAETPFMRPPAIAHDNVHAVHVVLHALDWLREQGEAEPEGAMMLLPTSPLRQPSDVRAAVELFDAQQADAVISLADLGKYMTNLRFLHGVRLEMVAPGENRNAQRQGLQKLYGVNGSVFLARPPVLRATGSFHVENALGYVMDSLRSTDINSEADLALVRQLFEHLPLLTRQSLTP